MPLLITMATAVQVALTERGTSSPIDGSVGHQHAKTNDRHQRSHEDARELGKELFARVGPEQIAALQVGQQVGRRSRRPRR